MEKKDSSTNSEWQLQQREESKYHSDNGIILIKNHSTQKLECLEALVLLIIGLFCLFNI